jgi:1-phosphofructokinase
MIITVTLNPALDKTVVILRFAAGRLNRIGQARLNPGGKGINVSKVIAGLGGKTLAMGILGGQTGEYIKSCLNGMGIETDYIQSGEPTRTNLKIIDPVLLANTEINEPGAPADEGTLRELLRRLKARVTPRDTVVLAGKAPEGADSWIFAQWIIRLHALGAAVYLDADGELLRLGVQAIPDVVKPNEDEFHAWRAGYWTLLLISPGRQQIWSAIASAKLLYLWARMARCLLLLDASCMRMGLQCPSRARSVLGTP